MINSVNATKNIKHYYLTNMWLNCP